jgi:hypothetical protein
MLRKNGAGPVGAGKSTGLGRLFGIGNNRGRMGGQAQAGIGGFCVCPKCGTKIEHKRSEPCNTLKCPQCGAAMDRG